MVRYGIALDFEVSYEEIIEFGAVCFETGSGRILEEFHRFVRPTKNKTIQPSVANYTNISQEQVDNGVPFTDAIGQFEDWMRPWSDSVIITWSCNDTGVFLKKECEDKRVRFPACLKTWCDLQAIVSRRYGRKLSLGDALQMLGISRSGSAHSALSDAKALASITVKLNIDVGPTNCI